MPFIDEFDLELQHPFSILIIASDGYAYVEDDRGSFDK